jgi:hypothetical protein
MDAKVLFTDSRRVFLPHHQQTNAMPLTENKKRKLGNAEGAEIVTCSQCKAEFVIMQHEQDECTWHSGRLMFALL